MDHEKDIFEQLHEQNSSSPSGGGELPAPSARAWERLETRLEDFERRHPKRREPLFRQQWLSLAVVIVVFLMLTAFAAIRLLLLFRG